MGALALVLASAKVLLIPLGIIAFLLFLLILGAIGLTIALSLISALSWAFRTPSRRMARLRSARRSQ
jgi:hypothetical protein